MLWRRTPATPGEVPRDGRGTDSTLRVLTSAWLGWLCSLTLRLVSAEMISSSDGSQGDPVISLVGRRRWQLRRSEVECVQLQPAVKASAPSAAQVVIVESGPDSGSTTGAES